MKKFSIIFLLILSLFTTFFVSGCVMMDHDEHDYHNH
jgi:hypothetical protein